MRHAHRLAEVHQLVVEDPACDGIAQHRIAEGARASWASDCDSPCRGPLSGVSSKTKNSNSRPHLDAEAHGLGRALSTRRSRPRGQTASARAGEFAEEQQRSRSSNGDLAAACRAGGARGRRDSRCASRYRRRCRRAVVQSQPSTTSQKPKPDSSAEINLSRCRYLPRNTPSMSVTPTLKALKSPERTRSISASVDRFSRLWASRTPGG